ncbi:MAG: carbamoylphosphate synthase large subunit [Chloroflexi bacterium]|nr:carbamoylphosphate synthase large subunit [Chloroflexota bacterium]
MARILLTGGRAPATLELARAFHRAGHTIFMAESLRGHLSRPSNVIKRNFLVPPPRQQPVNFINALKAIIVENKIDMLVPTCEEVFYVAMGREKLPCLVFVDSINKLNDLHNKWNFVVNAVGHELFIPETMLIKNQDDLLHAYSQWRQLVIKPVYSRFATRTLIRPTLKQAMSTLKFNTKSAWIAQEYIQGNQICTYSICLNGRITAHAAYPSTFTAGQGAAIAFKSVNRPEIFKWIKTFVEKNSFTGQIAFDFIEAPDGLLYALECNPRTTSGAHLLASHPNFFEAFINPNILSILPQKNHSAMLGTAMISYGLVDAFKRKKLRDWFMTFLTSKDVIFDIRDPLPYLLQFRGIWTYLMLARAQKITALEASTFDIEWNGESVDFEEKTSPRSAQT